MSWSDLVFRRRSCSALFFDFGLSYFLFSLWFRVWRRLKSQDCKVYEALLGQSRSSFTSLTYYLKKSWLTSLSFYTAEIRPQSKGSLVDQAESTLPFRKVLEIPQFPRPCPRQRPSNRPIVRTWWLLNKYKQLLLSLLQSLCLHPEMRTSTNAENGFSTQVRVCIVV